MYRNRMEHLSSALFVGLCHEIGSPKLIQIRRDVQDAKESLNPYEGNVRCVLSGSRREGIANIGSDEDFMIWSTDFKVIFDSFHSNSDNVQGVEHILAIPVHEEPGFVLLQSITNSGIKTFGHACIRIHNNIYLSSLLFRMQMLEIGKETDSEVDFHGPCISSTSSFKEVDFAYCFSCVRWPTVAVQWIQRCERNDWPSTDMINDMVQNGCHVVPIGARNSPFEQHEWRLSFSNAEKMMVTSMTHTQFLCYVLLKFFLKEVINIHIGENLICSYFLKTVLFWELQENNTSGWMPQNLLHCFWKCLRHLIQWVHKGYCPNFFIPNNNMFRGKIEGAVQTQLLTNICKLYDMGISCLFLSSTIRSYLLKSIQNPTTVINVDKINESYYFEREVFDRVFDALQFFLNHNTPKLSSCLSALDFILQATKSRMTNYKIATYIILASKLLQIISYFLTQDTGKYIFNRRAYIREKIACRMLKLAVRKGDISNILYLAMHYYRTCRYSKASYCVEITKKKLSHPYVIRDGMPYFSVLKRYEEIVGGLTLPRKIQNAWSFPICLPRFCNFMKILKLENTRTVLIIPPYVLVSMLSFLCNFGDPHKQDEALYDIHYLLLCDNGSFVHKKYRAISWDILGICHQLRGNLYQALSSYQQALKEMDFNLIRDPIKIRISSVMKELSKRK